MNSSYNSVTMKNVIRIVRKVAYSPSDVVLIGEFGTDKRRIVETIHQLSKGADTPLHEIDCTFVENENYIMEYQENSSGGIPLSQESSNGQDGRQETMYLENFDELSLKIQRNILNSLRTQSVPSTKSINWSPSGVRLILDIKPHYFNELVELLNEYQLHPVLLYIPALRERLEDLVTISREFVEKCAVTYNRSTLNIAPYIYLRLLSYHWPGNIIQLKHLIIQSIIVTANNTMTLSDLPRSIPRDIDRLWNGGMLYQNPSYWRAVGELVREVDRESENIEEVARTLKCNTKTARWLLQNGYAFSRKVFSDNLGGTLPNAVTLNSNTFNV